MEKDKNKESKEEVQVRGFRNSITDVFEFHEEEGDNNYTHFIWYTEFASMTKAELLLFLFK